MQDLTRFQSSQGVFAYGGIHMCVYILCAGYQLTAADSSRQQCSADHYEYVGAAIKAAANIGTELDRLSAQHT